VSQNIETTTQINKDMSLGDVISALKSKFSSISSENKMFSSLLAETNLTTPKIKVNKPDNIPHDKKINYVPKEVKSKAHKDDKHIEKSHYKKDDVVKTKNDDDQNLKAQLKECKKTIEKGSLELKDQNIDLSEISDVNNVDENTIVLKKAVDEGASYNDLKDILSSLLPKKTDEEINSLLDKFALNVEGKESDEDINLSEILVLTDQILQDQLKQAEPVDEVKIQNYEDQNLKVQVKDQDIDLSEISDVNNVDENTIVLKKAVDEEVSYNDLKDILSSLLPKKADEEINSLLEKFALKVEGKESDEDVNLLDALALISQILQDQLKQAESVDKVKIQNVSEKIKDVGDEENKLVVALSKINEQIDLLKDSKNQVNSKIVESNVSTQETKTDNEEVSLWQKMVQELKMESIGQKNKSIYSVPDNTENDVLKQNVDAMKLKQSIVSNQIMSKAKQVANNVGNDTKTTSTKTILNIPLESGRPTGRYDFSSQLSELRESKGGATGLPKVIEQVSVQLNKAIKNGKTEMTLNLRPAELGKIEIKLVFGNDKSVTGVIVAENNTSLHLLQKDVNVLVHSLQDAGLNVDASSMEFLLKDDGQSFSNAQNQNENKTKNQKTFGIVGDADSSGNVLSEVGDDIYYLEPGRVNLRV